MNPFDQWNKQADVMSLDQFLASQKKSQPTKTVKKKNSLTSFISELGGMGGAAGGAAIGTALLPGVGTLAGGAIGGFLGGTAGRVAENKVRDNRVGLGDALKEGAFDAVTGAGPIKAAKLGATGAKALATNPVSLVDALMAAGAKTGGPSLTTKVADNVATKTVNKDFRFTPSQLANFKSKYKEDAADVLRRHNLVTPDDIKTKGIQKLQDDFNAAVQHTPDINKADVMAEFKARYMPLIKSANTSNQKIGQQLRTEAQSINKTYGDVIPASEANTLRRSYDDFVNYSDKAANPAQYRVNKRAADVLRTTIQKKADSIGLVNTDGQTLKDVGQELSKLRKLSEYADKQDQLGKGNSSLGLKTLLGGSLGASAGGALGQGIPGAVVGAAGIAALNSRPVRQAAVKGTAAAVRGSTRLDHFGATPLGAATRVGAGDTAAGGLSMAQNLGSSQTDPQQPASLEDAMMASYGGQAPQTMDEMNSYNPASQAGGQTAIESSPYTKANMIADIQRDPKNTDKYVSLFKNLSSIYDPAPASATPGYTKPSAGQMAQATSATSNIDDLFNQVSNDPSIAGRSQLPGQSLPLVGGLISRHLGTGTYNNEAGDILNAIARINTGANMPASEQSFYSSKYLPQPGDSDATLQRKYQTLQNFFGIITNYPSSSSSSGSGSGSTSLEDVLSAYMQ